MKTKKPITISRLAAGVELLGRYTLQLALEQDALSKRVRRIERLLKGKGK